MISDTIIRLSSWLYVALIVITNIPQLDQFSLHPISMALLFAILVESILINRHKQTIVSGQDLLNKQLGKLEHQFQDDIKMVEAKSEQEYFRHGLLAYVSLFFFLVGFYVIEIKASKTWHSWLGLAFIVTVCLQLSSASRAK
ncbi:hypothetical protein BC829DRAFT_256446 [Chytridium lagenaria]|nr:hypothetical protein BC829DRAFT_256446 [Chytridium lagenaria]